MAENFLDDVKREGIEVHKQQKLQLDKLQKDKNKRLVDCIKDKQNWFYNAEEKHYVFRCDEEFKYVKHEDISALLLPHLGKQVRCFCRKYESETGDLIFWVQFNETD